MAAASKEMRNPATCLTDDLIVEVLSRLPVKSLCRFKCVSKHWLGLISHPHHRKKLPQTLAGFFYHTSSDESFLWTARHFTNVTGRGTPLIRPSLSFFPGHADFTLLDSCNGLLLCRNVMASGAIHYVVCNPATEEWVALFELSQTGNANLCEARLGFDPAISPNFHVFQFVVEYEHFHYVGGVEIYSSETGHWDHKDREWWDTVSFALQDVTNTVFLNGFLHVEAGRAVVAVDTEGNSWRTIPVPRGSNGGAHGDTDGFIGHSQGHLYYLTTVEEHDLKLSVYVLEDYASDQWIFKHSVSTSGTMGFGPLQNYNLIMVHPECHLIFFVSDLDHTIRCYDMDSRKVHVIHNMECVTDYRFLQRCLSYVPLFSESLAAWN